MIHVVKYSDDKANELITDSPSNLVSLTKGHRIKT